MMEGIIYLPENKTLRSTANNYEARKQKYDVMKPAGKERRHDIRNGVSAW